MALKDILNTLAVQIGTEPLELDDEGTITLEFDGTMEVSLEAEGPDAGRFTLTALVGPVPPADAEQMLRQALAYNLRTARFGGPVLALDEDVGILILAHAIDSNADVAAFPPLLDSFLQQLADWRDHVDVMVTDTTSAQAFRSDGDSGSSTMVRV
ncbi:type III secretion system chaperone [Caenispirillum salinarum]|nr:type III secretion system chaperone [Caenispirillum salinarum]